VMWDRSASTRRKDGLQFEKGKKWERGMSGESAKEKIDTRGELWGGDCKPRKTGGDLRSSNTTRALLKKKGKSPRGKIVGGGEGQHWGRGVMEPTCHCRPGSIWGKRARRGRRKVPMNRPAFVGRGNTNLGGGRVGQWGGGIPFGPLGGGTGRSLTRVFFSKRKRTILRGERRYICQLEGEKGEKTEERCRRSK